MTNREKVISGIECCSRIGREKGRGGCERCPYQDPDGGCRERLDVDALELLVQDEISEDDGK